MVEFPVFPRNLAVINIDLQNVFVEGSPIAFRVFVISEPPPRRISRFEPARTATPFSR